MIFVVKKASNISRLLKKSFFLFFERPTKQLSLLWVKKVSKVV